MKDLEKFTKNILVIEALKVKGTFAAKYVNNNHNNDFLICWKEDFD